MFSLKNIKIGIHKIAPCVENDNINIYWKFKVSTIIRFWVILKNKINFNFEYLFCVKLSIFL